MRFKSGSSVEVLSKKEMPSGSWCCAKIICGNGHNYTVRYDGFEGASDKAAVERVPRNAIRPCPPPLEVSENWVPGDLVEVFDNFSWKMATISKVFGKQYFLVRLLGSSQEFKVGKFEIRVRQFWRDDKWVVIGKGLNNYEYGKRGETLTLKYNQSSCLKAQKNETHVASSHNLKRRSPYLYSQDVAYDGSAEKFRAVEREGKRLRVISANLCTFSEQVDVALPRHMQGGKEIHASLNNRTTVFSDVDMERRKPSGDVGCFFAVNLRLNDADSVTCSVGSCSIGSNDSYKSPPPVSASSTEDFDDQLSDAESICQLGYEEGNSLLPAKEELAAEIHRLELHAYRCTIGALHASGPLSWEQEELVTNLRLSLHISNDEHLMELRNLVSGDNSIHIR
ncbi:PREDICTED: Plant Tudor RNA-binding [Prunus dulcis]|uniref:PREDICTED: Plant Tudor RNA-binding n=1 Tax=Prunus dulcis TaxID=3755 RepID=A0A5E4E6T3_PRUDU|nr:uncharacterized protein LOC117635152 [Prunus dulcis]VVA10689.1 PREDICTED: Plant Tudor RNA-binding [Prunus dulcis]